MNSIIILKAVTETVVKHVKNQMNYFFENAARYLRGNSTWISSD